MIAQSDLGQTDYTDCHRRMHEWLSAPGREDTIWLTEHQPVYTQGPRSTPLPPQLHGIPVVATNRGGLTTYHGPGQLVVYPLITLKDWQLTPTTWVSMLEQTLIQTLADWRIIGETSTRGRGVFVNGEKVASVGIRIRRGASMHGLALNVDMDLTPFEHITPCGLEGIRMVDMHRLAPSVTMAEVKQQLGMHLRRALRYTRGINESRQS